jgi:hypothetical protein
MAWFFAFDLGFGEDFSILIGGELSPTPENQRFG